MGGGAWRSPRVISTCPGELEATITRHGIARDSGMVKRVAHGWAPRLLCDHTIVHDCVDIELATGRSVAVLTLQLAVHVRCVLIYHKETSSLDRTIMFKRVYP